MLSVLVLARSSGRTKIKTGFEFVTHQNAV